MTDTSALTPEEEVEARRGGILLGILLLVWAVAFSQFKEDFSPVAYWILFCGVAVLIVAVPSWLAGQRVKRRRTAAHE